MANWSRESALTRLEDLIFRTDALRKSSRGSASHTRWALEVQRVLREVFGAASPYYATFRMLTWDLRDMVAIQEWDVVAAIDQHKRQAFLNDLETAKGLLQGAHDELKDGTLEEV